MEDTKYVNAVGKFAAEVKRPPNGWIGEAGKNKTPFIRIPLIVTEGDQINREVVWRGYITEASVGRTVKTLTKAFDWNGDLKTLAEDQEKTSFSNPQMVVLEKGKTTDSDPFTGKKCRITCEEEEWEGKPRIKVKWLNPYSEEVSSAIDSGTLKSIVDSVSSIAKSAAKEAASEQKEEAKKQKKETSKHVPKTHDEDGDEIPF